jgi:hypothetical protein
MKMVENEVVAGIESEKALQKFDVVEAGLAVLKEKYMAIKVSNVNDKDGAAMAHKARMDVVARRTDTVKDGEKMRKSAVEWQKTVLKRVNGVVDKCKEIENHLQEQEDIVENEKARIKAEAEAKEAARIQARRDMLAAMGVGFNGQMWAFQQGSGQGLVLPDAMLRSYNDDEFKAFAGRVQEAVDAENARSKAEEEANQAEAERVAKIAAEQEAERVRLAEIERKQKEEADALSFLAEQIRKRDEQARLDEEKRLQDIENARLLVIERAQRAEELEKARKEAAEKAIRDAEEKRLKDEADKALRDRLAAAAAEKKAARVPDKTKLLIFADSFDGLEGPDMRTEEGRIIVAEFEAELSRITKTLRDKAESL